MTRPLLALAFALVSTTAAVAAPTASDAGSALTTARGLVVEQVSRQADRLSMRVRADRDFSAARGIAVLSAIDESGRRVEIARAPLTTLPFDRSPRRRARRATASFALPADAPASLQVDLVTGR